MTRNILLIDDLRNFKTIPENSNLFIARTSREALNILQTNQNIAWDEIWFDHDLGDNEKLLDTSITVLDYLCERAFYENPITVRVIYIHTSNPAGRRQIASSLQRYGYTYRHIEASTVFTI